MAKDNGLSCIFCGDQCTCTKKKVAPRKVKPEPAPSVIEPAMPVPPVQKVARPNFAKINLKRVGRPVQTVQAPALEPEQSVEPAPVPPPPVPPAKTTAFRPPVRPTVTPPTRATVRPNLANVKRVSTNPEEDAIKAAIQMFADAGMTLEKIR